MAKAKQANKRKVLIGTGVLSWPRNERVSDRYGTVMLQSEFSDASDNFIPLDESQDGKHGRLIAEVKETRQSPHIGDLFRGIRPVVPAVGDVIELGRGTLFFDQCDGFRSVGLKPADGRKSDWLDPHQLYRAVHQTVALCFVPE